MGKTTGIAWCDHTFNPWWGCTKISPACTNCYAETFDHRLGGSHWGDKSPRKFFGDKHWNEPLKWNREAEKDGVRRRVFCASMADVFEDRPDLVAHRTRLWKLIEATPWLDWLLLTKRPENIEGMLPRPYPAAFENQHARPFFPNVWLGTTVEDNTRGDERIPHLIANPASVHFLSCEPLLGRVNLHHWLVEPSLPHAISWVITGSESGHGARPQNVYWYRQLRDQCARVGVAFFLKQAYVDIEAGNFVIDAGPGSWKKNSRSRLPQLVEQPYLDGVQHIAFPNSRFRTQG